MSDELEVDDIFDDDIVDEDEDEDDDEAEAEIEEEEEFEPEETEYPPLSTITIKVIPPDERISCNILSLYELAGVIGLRARFIENGDDYYVDSTDCSNAIEIAEKEILHGKCPMIIERTMRQIDDIKYVEHWKVNELIIDQTLMTYV